MKENIAEMCLTDTRDTLQRGILAENIITRLKLKTVNLSPIVLDGSWGSGKTVFCHQLKKLILDEHKEEFKVTYINAFMFDAIEDPFLMIMSHILEGLDIKCGNRTSLLNKSIEVGKVITKIGAKALLAHITRQNPDDIIGDATNAGKDEVSSVIDGIFSAFGKAQQTINDFKELLKSEIKDEKKVVVIIDEFDRCKPTFSLEILEKVKHVFDIEGLEFIFSMNAKELCSTIKKQYGYEIDAEEYLSKFYTCKIEIPKVVLGEYYAGFYLRKKLQESSFAINKEVDAVIDDLIEIIKRDKVSLRGIDKFLLNLKIFLELDQKDRISFDVESVFGLIGVFIYTFNSDLVLSIFEDRVYRELYVDYFIKETRNAILPHILYSSYGNFDRLVTANPSMQDFEKGLNWVLKLTKKGAKEFHNTLKLVYSTLNLCGK